MDYFEKEDLEKPEAPELCQEWFDGCNKCTREFKGDLMECTEKTCTKEMKPYCKKYFKKEEEEEEKEVPPDNCKSWFDGCNDCVRREPEKPFMCTRKACKTQGQPECKAEFAEEKFEEEEKGVEITKFTNFEKSGSVSGEVGGTKWTASGSIDLKGPEKSISGSFSLTNKDGKSLSFSTDDITSKKSFFTNAKKTASEMFTQFRK